MVSIHCFKKENLYCTWDDSLAGKYVVCADSLSSLYEKLESEEVRTCQVRISTDSSYPFEDMTVGGSIWRFAYITASDTPDAEGNPVKEAFMHGDTVLRKYGYGDWEVMDERSYFDLPGYEYRLSVQQDIRVSNKVLAMWLAEGRGLLLDTGNNSVTTNHIYNADYMYEKVPDGYKVMPMGSDDWLEPTEDVVQFQ